MQHLYLVCLLVSAAAVSASESSGPSALRQSYTCDRLDKVPTAERCTFVKENCISEGGLPYIQWYHCQVAPHGLAAKIFFTMFLAALLPILFTLLGDIAEIYFSPIMTHISQSIPKMRPRFAGVTFVAMGNGVTDLSANITAIRNGDILLSAGALTGGAMFIQCVVASEVMRASRGPVKCRGATLRDVGMYIASVVLVLASFAHGRITYWFIVAAVLLYTTYAVWVFLGDEWHERGRPAAAALWQKLNSYSFDRFRRHRADESLPWAPLELGAPARDEGLLTAPLMPRELEARELRAEGGGREGRGGSSVARDARSRPGSPTPQHLDGQQQQQLLLQQQQPNRQLNQHHHHRHLVSAKAYREMVWADLSDEVPATPGAEPLTSSTPHGRAQRRQRRSRQQPGGRDTMMAMASAVELGAGSGFGSSVPSQLVTLSSANGAALAAPVPVDAAVTRSLPRGSEAHGSAAHGGQTGLPAGAAGLQVVQSEWISEGGPGGSDVSEGEDDDDSYGGGGVMDEEAALLGSRQQRSSREGFWGEGDGTESLASSSHEGLADPERGWWSRLRFELTVGTSAEWEELPSRGLRRRWRTVSFPLLLPVYAAMRFTIPFVDPASYRRCWLVATCVGAPLLAAFYLAPGSWPAAVTALAAGAVLAAAIAYFTAGEEEALPDWDFGTSFAFGPAFFAVLGFFMGIIWIDILASEVVGVISLLASLLKLPASVMGLTLLAWGNSLGDFFGNPTMARLGKPTMALTACFAGPLFNMLTSMALGFGSYLARSHESFVKVELRPEVALGCGFLVLYNLAVATGGLMNRGSLPERFYLFARGWYVMYLAAACVLGLWGGQ